jgi:hypothetical protein
LPDTSKIADWSWKVFTVALSVLIVPLAGWVWSMNAQVTDLVNDLGDAEDEISKLEAQVSEAQDNSRAIIGIQKDIEYMKTTLTRIESRVVAQ